VVSATLVKSQSNANANGSGATADDLGTQLVSVSINGTPLDFNPGPNSVVTLPGLGFVVLNEQFCDGTPSPTTPPAPGAVTCQDGAGPPYATGRTVRSIHVFVTKGTAGLLPGAEVIVSEAHADASFIG
jgi:hypothetical protein